MIPSTTIAGYIKGLCPFSVLAQSLKVHKVKTFIQFFKRAQLFMEIEEDDNNKLDELESLS